MSISCDLRTICTGIAIVLSGCTARDQGANEEESSSTHGSSETTVTASGTTDSSETGSTTGDPCAGVELSLCDYCPASTSALCGRPCEQPGKGCSNDIGDGMSCGDGTWQCVVHPPLGTGCNLVCTMAEACTEIGCSDGLTLALHADEDGVTAGSYSVGIDADGQLDSCTFEISDDPGVCLGGPPCVPDTTCNALVLLGDPEQTIAILVAVVADITVTVQRDAEPPLEVSALPAYDVQAPNGPGCPPTCAVATLEIAAL